MQFNAEYVASSGGEVYNRSENAEEQTVSEMGDSFYNFLNDFHVNSSYIYRYWNIERVNQIETKSSNVLLMESIL